MHQYRERNAARSRLGIVPTYKITVVNEHYSSTNEHECVDGEAARKYAIKGALAIAQDQVLGGEPFFAAEVTLEGEDETVSRFVIAVGQSPLMG